MATAKRTRNKNAVVDCRGDATQTAHPRNRAPALTIWDGEKYFDAAFNTKERMALERKLADHCGYGADSWPPESSRRRLGISDHMGFEHDILHPAEEVVWPVFIQQGFTYEQDYPRLRSYALIHISREIGFDYHGFAKNAPKLPIDGFISHAKHCCPGFKSPRNRIERTIQEHKLKAIWSDWREVECERTGCAFESHWLCGDRFVEPDFAAIIAEIAAHNATRPKYAPPRLVFSRE